MGIDFHFGQYMYKDASHGIFQHIVDTFYNIFQDKFNNLCISLDASESQVYKYHFFPNAHSFNNNLVVIWNLIFY